VTKGAATRMRKLAPKARCRPLREVDVAGGIIPRLRDVVRQQPDKIAVADAWASATYAELVASAADLLTDLQAALARLDPPPARRCPEEFAAREPIAVLFGHEIAAVAAMVAVLASGHPLLVLDPTTPPDRLGQLADRLGVRLIVCSPDLAWLAASVRADLVVPSGTPAATTYGTSAATTYGPTRGADPARAAALWESPPDPCGVAVVAFTSGSTGAPKPVANDHRLLVRDAWNSSIATGCYDDEDVLAHTLPLAFHAGLTTTVHGLLVGATMHLYDTRTRGVAELPQFIRDRGCTVLISAPAVLRTLCAGAPEPALLRTLRRLTIAGEPAPAADVVRVQRLLPPSCVIRNRYGASETGLITEYVVDPATAAAGPMLPAGAWAGRWWSSSIATETPSRRAT
jgi:acyl-coenzyme A synthetase/AMP-(fatty) acid ligase